MYVCMWTILHVSHVDVVHVHVCVHVDNAAVPHVHIQHVHIVHVHVVYVELSSD